MSVADDILKMEYEKLTQVINDTIKKQDDLYRDLQDINPDERRNYKISSTVNDLTQQRNEIWNFLEKKYNENTKMRELYFKKQADNNKVIVAQTTEIENLKDLLDRETNKTTTNNKKFTNKKYEINKFIYYQHMYRVLIGCLLVIMLFGNMAVLGIFSVGLSYMLISVILGLMIIYVFVYYYVNNIGRDAFYWDKFIFERNTDVDKIECDIATVNKNEEANAKMKNLEKTASSRIQEFNKQQEKCNMNLITNPEDDKKK